MYYDYFRGLKCFLKGNFVLARICLITRMKFFSCWKKQISDSWLTEISVDLLASYLFLKIIKIEFLHKGKGYSNIPIPVQ